MSNLEKIVQEAAALGAANLAETLGLSSGEISQSKARSIFGKWFTEAEKAGRIHPVRIGNGRNGIRHYRVVDIHQLRTADLIQAELQTKYNL